MPETAEFGVDGSTGVEDGNVGAVDFVPAESVVVGSEGSHVDLAVGGEGDAVDAEAGVGEAVDFGCDGGDGVNPAEDIGSVCAADESGVGVEERAEVLGREGWVGGYGGSGRGVIAVLVGGLGPPFDCDVGVESGGAYPS